MNTTRIALAAALAAAFASAHAQSAFSIPNPIMKPQSIAAGGDVALKRGPGMPSAAPRGGDGAMVPPLPDEVSQATLPGQRGRISAPGNDTVIRDTLATFTVTAIVGNRAVLRNNVGTRYGLDAGPQNSQGNGTNSSTAMSANGSNQGGQVNAMNARQTVIRVKTDVPVFVAGVELVPTVLESRVEFRVAGRKQVVSTVVLESQSSYGYVPQQTQRETSDPGVTIRMSPNPDGGAAPLTGGTTSGAPGASNGMLPSQH